MYIKYFHIYIPINHDFSSWYWAQYHKGVLYFDIA